MMRQKFFYGVTVMSLASLSMLFGCSSSPFHSSTDSQELSPSGLTILNPRTEPGTFETTRDLKPIDPPVVLAEVKDITGNLTEVHLQIENSSVRVPMTRVAGTTWRGKLTDRQLQTLAINGKTLKYQGTIHARNDRFRKTASARIEIRVKAPQVEVTG
ncbi:MAG: hypothetical protein RJB38_1638 [Pseudomonadota bacterium]|jgi:hypothetical protein